MIINLTAEDRKQYLTLLHKQEINIEAARRLGDFLTKKPRDITARLMKRHAKLSNDETERYARLLVNITKYGAKTPLFEAETQNLILKCIKKLDEATYLENPFYQTIKSNRVVSGYWEILTDVYRPYQGFAYNDVNVDEGNFYEEVTPIGFFSERFPFLAVLEKGVTWMSVTPFEIETMKPHVEAAAGNILVLGLGLGYFPFMVASKESVSAITVVEQDEALISLFKENLLPQFPNKEKIRIVNADAFAYIAQSMIKEKFDFAFADLWHDVEDGLALYLRTKVAAAQHRETEFHYWLEQSMLAMLRRCMVIMIGEQIDGRDASNYQQANDMTDAIINQMYFLFEDTMVSSYEEIDDLLNDASLKTIAERLVF